MIELLLDTGNPEDSLCSTLIFTFGGEDINLEGNQDKESTYEEIINIHFFSNIL